MATIAARMRFAKTYSTSSMAQCVAPMSSYMKAPISTPASRKTSVFAAYSMASQKCSIA
jgi:hypothetical protein